MKSVNFGGLLLNIQVKGADKALDKLDRLNQLLKEANSLTQELASRVVSVMFVWINPEPSQVDF